MRNTSDKGFENPIGLSYAYGPEDWEAALDHINPQVFSGVEIPGQFLEVRNISDEFKASGLEIFNVRDPLPQSMTRNVYDQSPQIVEKIREQLSIISAEISGFPCRNVTMDFGMDLAVLNAERKDFIIKFIRQTTPVLHREKLCLCLPARVPMQPPATPENYFSFLKEAMYGGLRFCVDIYPHETLKATAPEELLRWYRFDMNIARFVYEPEAGNLIVGKILETWFAALKKISFRGPIIFCPKISSSAHFIRESERLAGMIKEINEDK